MLKPIGNIAHDNIEHPVNAPDYMKVRGIVILPQFITTAILRQ